MVPRSLASALVLVSILCAACGGGPRASTADLVSIRQGQAQDPPVYPGDIIVVDGSSVKATEKRILQSIPLLAIFGPL